MWRRFFEGLSARFAPRSRPLSTTSPYASTSPSIMFSEIARPSVPFGVREGPSVSHPSPTARPSRERADG
jgi:hypothetical protein